MALAVGWNGLFVQNVYKHCMLSKWSLDRWKYFLEIMTFNPEAGSRIQRSLTERSKYALSCSVRVSFWNKNRISLITEANAS